MPLIFQRAHEHDQTVIGAAIKQPPGSPPSGSVVKPKVNVAVGIVERQAEQWITANIVENPAKVVGTSVSGIDYFHPNGKANHLLPCCYGAHGPGDKHRVVGTG